jgi:hypothetical protein
LQHELAIRKLSGNFGAPQVIFHQSCPHRLDTAGRQYKSIEAE